MASAALDSDDNIYTGSSESDESYESNSDEDSYEEDCQSNVREPCKYYNNGRCRDGDRCPYLHVCKYALKGNCKYGSSCKLNHPRGGRESSRGGSRERSASRGPVLTNGRYYQWQLNDGSGWEDVDNDHIIEAQYCLPHNKSIKIYNTPYGAVSIDFRRMRVYGKSLRVRRLDDGNTVWTWYCTLRRKWIQYGNKDSKGKSIPVKSSDIEQNYQSNPSGSFTFSIGSDSLEIKFKEMQQVSKKKKRKVSRRPLFKQQAGAAVSQVASGVRNLTLGTKPQWQFEGKSTWHVFKCRQRGSETECSVTSDDIEKQYQLNPQGSMTFKVSGDTYKLDFRAMTQTNLRKKHLRRVKRVLV